MRRLSIFALALFLALVGVQLVIGPELFASYVGRDAALLWVGAAVAGALFAATWRPRAPQRWVSEPPRIGRLLLYTGIAVTLAAGLAQGFLAGSPLALMLQFAWWLGLALLLIGAWWPGGRVEYAAPPVQWRRDAAGAFVPQGHSVDVATAPRLRRSSELVWLAAILLCAALLRFWDLANLPPGCTGSECVNGLRLVEGETIAGAGSLFEQGARLVFWVTGNGVLSLRLTAGLFSLLTVVALWAAARRLAGAPAALLVALFVSFSPLQLWAARSSDPWVAVGLLVALALWWTAEALVQRTLRWWVLAGLALAAIFVQAPPLRGATLLWLAAVAAIALVHVWRRPHRGDWAAIAAGMAAALSLALPTLFAGNAVDPLWGAATLPQTANNLALLAATLLRVDSAGLPAGAELGLLSGLALALAVVGVGALTRHVRVAAAAGLLAGLLLFAWFGARLDGAFFPPTQVALALLPFVFAAAAVALDQFLTVLVQTWRSVVAPQRLVAAVALVIGLVVVWNAAGFMAGLDQVATGGGQTEGDMARFVAQLRLSEPDAELTFILPSAATTHPSLRLLAGPALAAGRILPLESARTLPFAAEPPGDLLYLLPIADGQVLRVLQQLYPSGVAFTELDQAGERAIFNAFRVPRAAVQAARQVYVQIATPDNPAAASFGAPALDFAWRANPPAPAPFVAQVTSALIVPETGVYTIAAERSATLSGLLLTLDDMLVLDTALNLTSQQLQLVQGVYTLALTYRSGEEPGDLRITWQRPDGATETIGGAALHWPPPPRQGLVASYYANAQFSGAPSLQRKELVVGADPPPPLPYSVHWRGKLAAPRAGEYLLGMAGVGLLQASLDNQLLLDNSSLRSAAAPAADPGYVESLVYLPSGWRGFDVRFAPEAATGRLRLLWQPAGGNASELDGAYLLPTAADIATGDIPLPAPPPLADPGLGDDFFALNRASAAWQPQQRIPPADLAPLPLEAVWAYGAGCGAGENQLSQPRGLAFDPATRQLYVADTGNRRVAIITEDGAPGGVITSDIFQEPVDVAFAPGGSTPLILDNATQQIYRVDESGALLPIPLQTSFYRPRGFAVDASGGYVVADTGGGRMAVLTPEGEQVLAFGGQGSLLARGQPVDAVEANGVYWVVSAEDGRLWNTLVDGSLTAIQPTNTIDGPHLAALPDGRLLLTDPARSLFWLLSAQGQPTGQFAYAGQLDLPTGIAAREDDDGILIAVSDTRRCSVSLWRLGDQG